MNISSRVIPSSLCPPPSFTIGIYGAGFDSAYIKSCAARIFASMEDICGMLNFFWERFYCVCYSFRSCLGGVCLVTPVVIHYWSYISAVFYMLCP